MAAQDYDVTGQNGNDYRNSCENWCNIGIYLVDQTPEQGPLCETLPVPSSFTPHPTPELDLALTPASPHLSFPRRGGPRVQPPAAADGHRAPWGRFQRALLTARADGLRAGRRRGDFPSSYIRSLAPDACRPALELQLGANR